MDRELKAVEGRPRPLDPFGRVDPLGLIVALILGGSLALTVWLGGTFLQRFAAFISSIGK